jgi:hypothetical protein
LISRQDIGWTEPNACEALIFLGFTGETRGNVGAESDDACKQRKQKHCNKSRGIEEETEKTGIRAEIWTADRLEKKAVTIGKIIR